MKNKKAIVGVIMGSQSDYETMKGAVEILKAFQVPHEVNVVSAHRSPLRMEDYAKNAEKRGLQIIIAGAGGAAHLPGMTASLTTIPVIGVPVESRALKGLDSLLSIVQMPAGVPVMTMSIGLSGAKNAALSAVRILALHNEKLARQLDQYNKKMIKDVLATNKSLKRK